MASESFPAPDDLQALLLGHLRRPFSRHLLFQFGRREGARRLLAALTDGVVTMGDSANVPLAEPLTSLGVTWRGLRALDLASELLDELDSRFMDGIAPKRLGDHPSTSSDISNWWEGRFDTADVHCLVHVHALEPAQLDERVRDLCALAAECDVTELIPRNDGTRLEGAFLNGPGKLHFGYMDGISAPRIAWDHEPADNEVDFRHFVLGYADKKFPSKPTRGRAVEFARGSSYGVFRWIHQHVAVFNRFLRDEGPRLFPHLEPAEAEQLLAAKLMGRWRDGTPLVLSPDRADPALAACDDFRYHEADPDGLLCPLSAHIRVMNPRDQPLKVAAGKVPTVLRRGTPYGPPLQGTVDDGVDRGLIGVFLCADIGRQVLTLTAWATQNDFSEVYRGGLRTQDALIGNRVTKDPSFSVPGSGVIPALPSFLTTKGTVLALYPGRATLEALTAR